MPRSPRSLRLILVGLLSTVLALGATATATGAGATAPPSRQAAPTAGCTQAQQQDASAAQQVEKKAKKAKKAKKSFAKAKKVFKKQPTANHRKALKKAKAKKAKAKKALKAARASRATTANRVVVFCGTNPDGTPAPTTTPGVSPLAPLCLSAPQFQALCDATQAAGSTAPLQPFCAMNPQFAPVCAVMPGGLATPEAVQALTVVLTPMMPTPPASLLDLLLGAGVPVPAQP